MSRCDYFLPAWDSFWSKNWWVSSDVPGTDYQDRCVGVAQKDLIPVALVFLFTSGLGERQ